MKFTDVIVLIISILFLFVTIFMPFIYYIFIIVHDKLKVIKRRKKGIKYKISNENLKEDIIYE